MHHCKRQSIPAMLLSTDAEKAFDRVDWVFLKSTLAAINLGPRMQAWISTLYTSPTAKLRINGELSLPFHIRNGTRQGCPLSPLLFVLSLENFLSRIRNNPDISGIKIGNREHKIAAYADDLLFFLRNPRITLPNLLNELKNFALISNFKINLTKSVAQNLSIPPAEFTEVMHNFPIKTSHSYFTYLGIKIYSDLKLTIDRNYGDFLNAIKTDLHSWSKPTLSWIGRINSLKMNVLPRFLYISQAIPYPPPKNTLRTLNTLTKLFVWDNKNPRLARNTLCAQKSDGSLSLPDWEGYHKATVINRCLDWSFHRTSKLWISVEQESSTTPLWAATWLPPSARIYSDKTDTKLRYTLDTWDSLTKSGKWSNSPTPLLPVFGNPAFTPGLDLDNYKKWKLELHSGISFFYKRNQLKTLEDLLGDTTPTDLDRFKYRQIRHFIHSTFPPHKEKPEPTEIERIWFKDKTPKRAISLLYKQILNLRPHPADHYRTKWEKDLNITIDETQWAKMICLTHTSSQCTKIQELNYKILTKWYRYPTKLNKIYRAVSPNCWRCGKHPGTLTHIFWSCPALASFWSTIRDTIKSLTDIEIPDTASTILLHDTFSSAKAYRNSLVPILLDTAKALIPVKWRTTESPTTRDWLHKVAEICKFEELKPNSAADHQNFITKWFHWKEFTNTDTYRQLCLA
uniref:Reverse transcriptase domain-containing protein n=1 Tax=Xenopus tropicalis TaxID=8364 RepID=A0A803KCV2_XENTR